MIMILGCGALWPATAGTLDSQCCDPADYPESCEAGASCCRLTNKWKCNDASGEPTCTTTPPGFDCFCGGIAGAPCLDGSYCDYLHACDTVFDGGGTCRVVPETCLTDFCAPVCTCDDITYPNECFARQAEAHIVSTGRCDELDNVRLDGAGAGRVYWGSVSGALSYNVYRKKRTGVEPVDDMGACFAKAVTSTSLDIPAESGDPEPGEVWLFQVSANDASGEGSLGQATNCTYRRPVAWCE